MTTHSRWTLSQVTELFEKPLLDLLFEAQQIHRQHFDPRQVPARKTANIVRKVRAIKPALKLSG